MLLKSRAVTVIAVLALGLGIGANTAMFNLVDAALLRPLPYRDADLLTMVWQSNPAKGVPLSMVSAPDFLDLQQQNTVFEGMAAFEPAAFALTGAGEPERVRGALVTGELFGILGVQPALGRVFLRAETQPGGPRAVILSSRLWQRRFAEDPGVLGSAITLDGTRHNVVGVMPAGFEFPDRDAEIWAPLAFGERALAERGYHHLGAVARLKTGIDIGRARGEMNFLAQRFASEYPVTNRGWRVRLVSVREQQYGDVRPALLILLGAVGFVLLIACVNVANLLLARNAAREKEVAVRKALGAPRSRLVRQFLTESLLLSLGGGALGLCLAPALTRVLLWLRPETLPLPGEAPMRFGVLAFTFGISVATGFVFGIIPALEGSEADLSEVLKEGGRSGGDSAPRRRIRNVLAIVEVAISLVLLVGAGLMLRTLHELQAVDPGFRAEHVLTVRLALPEPKYATGASKVAFIREAVERVSALPGVTGAAATTNLPLVSDFGLGFLIEGRPLPGPGETPFAGFRSVTTGYFRAMGIPVHRGRAFSTQDIDGAPEVVVINEALARRYWPDYPRDSPVGRRVKFGIKADSPWRTIVGVAGDVRHRGLDAQTGPELYAPYDQYPFAATALVLRTASDPTLAASAVRGEIRAVDKDQPLGEVRAMERVVADSIAPRRALMALLASFGGLALVLAALGIYGVVAYAVLQRTNEFGIRMALGAQPADIRGMVVREALKLSLSGVAIGAAASFLLSRVLATQLFGVSVTDPAVYAAVAALLIAVALVAGYLPARHATRVDPINALRVP